MSSENRSALSRRHALKTGGLAAIAASLIAPATVTNAAPKADTAYMADLTASSRRYLVLARETLQDVIAAEDALRATMTPEQLALFRAYDNVYTGHMLTSWEFRAAELARHLPGMAPAIVSLWHHITDGGNTPVECCRTADWGSES